MSHTLDILSSAKNPFAIPKLHSLPSGVTPILSDCVLFIGNKFLPQDLCTGSESAFGWLCPWGRSCVARRARSGGGASPAARWARPPPPRASRLSTATAPEGTDPRLRALQSQSKAPHRGFALYLNARNSFDIYIRCVCCYAYLHLVLKFEPTCKICITVGL